MTENNLLAIMEDPNTKETKANNNNEVKQRSQVNTGTTFCLSNAFLAGKCKLVLRYNSITTEFEKN